ncbi:RHS repeat domain-containing protein [Treponema pedis]|uniref:RHS repeat domain-containing protein n=1 Tax=Treponema pedis TaxID=409322 RepID=UPI00041EAFCB|nr:RHS repeat-associated core domain-containing protein [Treponema pedis]
MRINFFEATQQTACIFSKEMTHTNNYGDNEEQKEKRYYYHSDHLGSAQFVTDWRGKQYEHIEYTPYGELWTYKSKTAKLFLTTYNNFLAKQPEGLIEETAPGIDKLPFRFTGKELDEETGLYYYGARYLDPKYSRWLSGDPALNDYIPKAPIDDEAKKHNENLPGMGGVFNVVNLHVYHYAGNNPIKYIDPDGREDGFPKNFKETVIYLQGKLVSTEVENFQLTRLLNIAKGFVDSNMAKLPEQESGWNLYKDDYGDCCFDRVQLIASILISEGFSVSYIKTIKPKGFNFHIAALVRIGYKSYVVDTIKIYTGATGITSPENWLKKQSPKDYEIIPASKNAKLIPNKHIKFWYDKSALPDENYDDFAARQIEYYIKTGDVEL